MNYIVLILVVALAFGICFLVDKGFTKLYRSKKQHQSGMSVRLSKRYGSIGAILTVVGISGIFMGANNAEWLLLGGACVLVLGGIALVVYYMSFGIYYDEDTFLMSSFGKDTVTYRFADIRSQQLYLASGNVVVELHMEDGKYFQVHTGMTGMYPFMDHAFQAWLRQTGRTQEDCPWYDPQNSCWFPELEA